MTAYDYWEQQRNVIRSRNGGWRIGTAVYNHGYSMMDELVGEIGYFQQMILNVTGKIPEQKMADWLEAAYICISWPDPRIWCNQMAALSASSRTSAQAGLVSGLQAVDSMIYGAGCIVNCQCFIQDALVAHNNGATVADIVQQAKQRGDLPGYARPVAKGDERVLRMREVSQKLGFEVGPHETLANQISDYLVEKDGECLNFAGYMVAFMADQGFTPEEDELLNGVAVHSGIQACYIDSRARPAGNFLPMHCDDMEYTGSPDRDLPLNQR